LCALIKTGRIPLAIACVIFNLKVEPVLRFARWLWGMDKEAIQIMSDAYDRWARELLGVPHRSKTQRFANQRLVGTYLLEVRPSMKRPL
jgi:fatty acid-binding protein DegV